MADSLTANPAVERFAEVARRYCMWAAGGLGEPQREMRRAQQLLAELHLAAIGLPGLSCGDDVGETSVPHEEWARVFDKFGRLPVTNYLDVFNPLKDEAPVINSLADDLADIYRDLKEGLFLFDDGHPTEASWEWRLGFQTHWGQHLVGAQRALHEYLSDEGL